MREKIKLFPSKYYLKRMINWRWRSIMNLISWILIIVIGLLVVGAVVYIIKNGSCSECSKCKGDGDKGTCCGNCSACHGCSSLKEKKK